MPLLFGSLWRAPLAGCLFLVDASDFSQQNYLLDKLREQGKRIENLSKIEHDLIKEVHPQVGEIKEGMDEMIAASKEKSETKRERVKGARPTHRPTPS
jgi:hypothetical protein